MAVAVDDQDTGRVHGAGSSLGDAPSSMMGEDGLDQAGVGDVSPADEELFQKLRDLRTVIAREIGKPPYIVFSDKALRDMCRLRPTDDAAFLAVNGVGQHKLEQYGTRFMKAIADFSTEGGVEG